MSLKSALNYSAVLLSCISGLLTFVVFVLSSFYSTAKAEWTQATTFRTMTEQRLQLLEMEARAQRESVAKDISEIKSTLSQIVEVRLRVSQPR